MSISRRLSRGPSWIAARAGLAVACFVACSDEDTAPTPPPEPPALTIEGFLSSDGERLETFAPDETVGAPCDGLLAVLVGPVDNAGRLGEWELRPPGTCGRIASCAYLVARLFDDSGAELATAAAATARVPLAVAQVPTGAGYRVTVELRQGATGELVTVDAEDADEPVPRIAEATLDLEARTCPTGPGSGGAPGGTGGSAPGEGGLGGLGGMGGGF